MALRVTTQPTYTGTLKVKPYKPPTTKLKVTTKPVNYVKPQTYNPQKQTYKPQATYNPQPATYNPQKTATSRQLNTAKVSKDWAKKEATRLRREADRRAQEKKRKLKRLADAKNIEIEGQKQNWLGKLTFQGDFKARNARETAIQYWQYNNDVVAPSLEARYRNFEREQAERYQQAVEAIQRDPNIQADVIKAFDDWEQRYIQDYERDVTEFTTEQQLLQQYGATPITSFTGNALGGFKRLSTKVGKTGWNTLKKITETGERSVNTVKNLVKPDNLRMYYDGTEKKGGVTGRGSNPFSTAVDAVRRSYNATEDQRVVGFSKADEADRLAGGKPFQYKDYKTGEVKTGYTKEASGFNRLRIMYGDDVANLMLDPLNVLPNNWFGKGTKAIKSSKFGKGVSKLKTKGTNKLWDLAGSNKRVSDFLISREARKANPNRIGAWLNKRVGTSTDDFFGDNKKLIKFRNDASEELGKRTADWRQTKQAFSAKTQAGLSKLTDDEARILQEYMLPHTFGNNASRKFKTAKNVFDWSDVEVPRGFSKQSRRKIEDLARSLKNESDRLTKMSIDYDDFYNAGQNAKRFKKGASAYKRGQGLQYSYVPNYNPLPKAGNFDEASSHASRWWLKQKAGNSRIQQGAKQLQESFGKRASSQLYNDTYAGRWLAENANDYTKAIGDASQALNWRKQGYGNSYFNKLNTASLKNPVSPLDIWRKSVLLANPSWYVNNVATNIPFSISAGGASVIPEYLKILKNVGRNFRKKAFSDLPEGVTGNIDSLTGGGRLGKFASNIEDTSRVATYRALRKKGFSEADALKDMNRWLFDYSVKNWERPIRNVAPFYKWQANLMRQSVQMPFTRPRSAKFYNSVNQQLFERPINRLPDYEQTYIDEDGKKQTFNPKEGFRGKMFIGNDENGNPKFASTPFWAMNPNTMTDVGLNPFLSTAMDFYTGEDRWGRTNTDRNGLQLLGERFPQYNVGKAYADRNNKEVERYFTASGNSKWKQGYDPSLPNYDQTMDKKREFTRRRNSFLGGQIFNTNTFDKGEYDKKFRLSSFNEDFFAKDWEKRLEELQDKADGKYYEFEDPKNPFNVVKAEQEQLAKDYGFDLQKDIYDNYWSKNDTATTRNTKRLKQEARDWSGEFWEDYLSLPQGSRTQASKRRPFLIDKYREWADNDTFAENGYRRLPKFTVYKDGQATEEKAEKNLGDLKRAEADSQARRVIGKKKYQRYLAYQKAKKSGDWSWFEKDGNRSEKAKAYLKAKESGDWTEYTKKYGDNRKVSPYKYDGKNFKSQESMDKYIEGAFWRDYYALDSIEDRKALLDEFPQFRTYDQPQTQEEWDQIRTLLREKRNKQLSTVDGFDALRSQTKKRIERSYSERFGGRRLKYKF